MTKNLLLLMVRCFDLFMKVVLCAFLYNGGIFCIRESLLFWLIDCVFMYGRSLCVILVFSTKGQRFRRVGLDVPLFGSMACLRRMVAKEGKLSPDQVKYYFCVLFFVKCVKNLVYIPSFLSKCHWSQAVFYLHKNKQTRI